MDSKVFWQLNEAYQLGVCNQIEEETLSEEELLGIQEWVEALIKEGYNLDEYSDEELYEVYLEDLQEARGEGPQAATPGTQLFQKLFRGVKKEKGSKGTRMDIAAFQGKGSAANRRINNEEIDLYDIVSEYLISEGFCNTDEDASVIMANMSEEWRNQIIENLNLN